MKKITLKNLNLKEVEQLSRNQLKEVLGGYVGGGTTQASCFVDCTCPPGYKVKDSNQTRYSVGVLCNEGESCVASPSEGVACSGGSSVLCDDSFNCEEIPILT